MTARSSGTGDAERRLCYTRFSMNRRDIVTVHQFRYTVLFEPAEEGGYVITCPALPGLVTEGNTLEEARAMAADAIGGYLEGLAKDGLPFPADDPNTSSSLVKEAITVAVERG